MYVCFNIVVISLIKSNKRVYACDIFQIMARNKK
jgi:hypothetical protein